VALPSAQGGSGPGFFQKNRKKSIFFEKSGKIGKPPVSRQDPDFWKNVKNLGFRVFQRVGPPRGGSPSRQEFSPWGGTRVRSRFLTPPRFLSKNDKKSGFFRIGTPPYLFGTPPTPPYHSTGHPPLGGGPKTSFCHGGPLF